MPTVPARRSILTGRRVFPFRGWHPYPGLLAEPGWAPIGDVRTTFTSALKRSGYWTAYVTDNVALAFSPPWGPFRRSFDRFVRRGGQIGGTDKGVSDAQVRHWLPPEIEDADTRDRIRRYLANGHYEHDETQSFAARVFRDASRVLEDATRKRPFAMVVDTFEPHEPWTPPRRYLDMYGDPDYHGPEPARPYYAPVERYLHGSHGAGAARSHARALRGRGDHDRPLAGCLPRPLPRARPRSRHGGGAGLGPRLLPGRLRLHRQDLVRPAPAADQDCR